MLHKKKQQEVMVRQKVMKRLQVKERPAETAKLSAIPTQTWLASTSTMNGMKHAVKEKQEFALKIQIWIA